MIHILDKQTDILIEVLDNDVEGKLFWGDVHHDSINNLETFDFTARADVPGAQHLTGQNRIIIPADKPNAFKEFIIFNTFMQTGGNIEVKSNGSYLELAKDKIMTAFNLGGQTPEQAMAYGLQGTNWQVGNVEYSDKNPVIASEERMDAYQYLLMIAETYGMQLDFRVQTHGNRIVGRFVDLLHNVGDSNGKEIVLGKDLVGIVRQESTDDLITALVVEGPPDEYGGRISVNIVDDDALQRWGRDGRHRWDYFEVTAPEGVVLKESDVRAAGQKELDRRMASVVQYTVDAVSLEHVFGLSHERALKGDMVRIKDESFVPPLYLDARLIDVKRSLSDPSAKEFTLGEFIEYSADEVMSTFRQLRNALAKKVGREELEGAIAEVGAIIKQPTPPINPKLNTLWLDTSRVPNVLYRWNDVTWVKASPTVPDDIGAVPPEYVDNKVDGAIEAVVIGGTNLHRQSSFALQALNAYPFTINSGIIENIAAQAPPFTNALKVVKSGTAKAGHEVVLFQGSAAAGKLGKSLTTSMWIKYTNIVRGANTLDVLKLGELSIDYLDASGVAKNAKQQVFALTGTSDWDEITKTIKIGAGITGIKTITKITSRFVNEGASGTHWITGIMIEEATKRSAWTESQSDIIDYTDATADFITQQASEFTSNYAQKRISQSLTAPANPVNGDFWIDISKTPHVWKRWNGAIWANASATSLAELDGLLETNQIAVGAVTTGVIADGAITAGKLLDDAVTSAKIAAGAITESKVGTGAVTNTKLAALAVDAAKLASNAVTTDKIMDSAISGAKVAANAITELKINPGAITNSRMADLAIDAAKLAAGAVTNAKLADNAVTGAKILDDAISAGKIAANAVTELKINPGAVTNTRLANLAVDAAKLASGAVTETKLGTGAVTSTKILDAAIITAKLAAGAVTELKIGDSAITNTKLAALAVDAAKLADSAVTATKIANLAVGTAAIQDAAITNAKVGELDASKITTGRLDAGRVQIGAGTEFAAGFDPTKIEVGGRNLVTSEQLNLSKGGKEEVIESTSTKTYSIFSDLTFEKGDYVYSVMFKKPLDDTGASIRFFKNGVTVSYYGREMTNGEYNKIVIPFTVVSETDTYGSQIYNHDFKETFAASISIKEVKIEKGTRATDWTPAPEDITTEISAAQTLAIETAALDATKKADAAQLAAINSAATDASAKATAAETAAKVAAAADAASKAAAAESAAKTAAAADAKTKADAAQAAAIAASKTDASTKATAAETAAKAAAALDATAKAAQAEAAAKAAAATDAQTKATTAQNAAISAAKTYSDSVVKPANDRLNLWKYLDTTFIDGGSIFTNTITANQIAVGTITAASGILANAAVGTAVIADAAITSAKIANLAVGTAAIADAAITNAKIKELDAEKITTGRLDAARVQIGSGTTFAAGFDPTSKETPAGAQAKATAAQTAAVTAAATDATSKANAAETAAKTAAAADAASKAAAAESAAKTAAAADAKTKADAAQAAAIAAGKTDASTKATAAETAAKTYAAAEAAAKAASAEAAAKAAAATDATSKANAAQTAATAAAKTYSDSVVKPANDRLALWQYADTTFIDGGDIYTNTITANQIAVGAITAASGIIADAAITNAKIANAAITSAKIGTAAVGTAAIADAAITNAKIDSLDAAKITTGRLDAARVQIGSGTAFAEGFDPTAGGWERVYSVNTATPLPLTEPNGALFNADYSYEVQGEVRPTGTVTGAIGIFSANTSGVWTFTAISEKGKSSNHINFTVIDNVPSVTLYGHASFYSVHVSHRRTNGVGSPGTTLPILWKYADTTFIDGGNIYANSVTANQIATGTITAASGIIADAAITSAKIANLAVGTAAIQDAAITNAKIKDLHADKITAGTINAARIQIGATTTFAAGFDPTEKETPSGALAKAAAAEAAAKTAAAADAASKAAAAESAAKTAAAADAKTKADAAQAAAIAAGKTDASGKANAAEAAAKTFATSEAAAKASAAEAAAKAAAAADATTKANAAEAAAKAAAATDAQAKATAAKNEAITAANSAATAAAKHATDRVNLWTYTGTTFIDGGDIYANSVTANQLSANSVTASQIAALSIAAGAIQANAVSADKLAVNAVTADKIAANAITAVKIAANAITADKIAANSITSNLITTAGLDAAVIKFGTMTGITADLGLGGITATGTAASSVRLWAGSSFAARDAAPFRVTQDGAVYASNMQIVGGTIDGARMNTNNANGTLWTIVGDGQVEVQRRSGFFANMMYRSILTPDELSFTGTFDYGRYGVRRNVASGTGTLVEFCLPDKIDFRKDDATFLTIDKPDSVNSVITAAGRLMLATNAGKLELYHSSGGDTIVRGYQNGNAASLLKWSATGLQVRIATDGSLASIQASAFSTSSLEKYKKDIKPFGGAIQKVRDAKIYDYVRTETEEGREETRQIGLLHEEAPDDVKDSDETIDLYSMISVLWKAVQELADVVESSLIPVGLVNAVNNPGFAKQIQKSLAFQMPANSEAAAKTGIIGTEVKK